MKIKSFVQMSKIKPNAIVLPDAEWEDYIGLLGYDGDKQKRERFRKHGIAFFRGIRVIKLSKVKSLANT